MSEPLHDILNSEIVVKLPYINCPTAKDWVVITEHWNIELFRVSVEFIMNATPCEDYPVELIAPNE